MGRVQAVALAALVVVGWVVFVNKKVPRAARREILLSFRRRNLPVNNR